MIAEDTLNFDSLEQILNQLEQQPGWEKFRDYRQLLKVWQKIVSSNTLKHTYPLYISRQILWVATSSSSRAQELSFQRYTLLKKLNQELSYPLKDIRFSPSGWEQKTALNQSRDARETMFIASKAILPSKSKNKLRNLPFNHQFLENDENEITHQAKAKASAKRWLEKIRYNSSSLSCPVCNSPASSQELKRWNSCYICIAKKWSEAYQPPTFPNS